MKQPHPYSLRFFPGTLDLSSLVSDVKQAPGFSRQILQLAPFAVGGVFVEQSSILISDGIFKKIGGMVYGNGQERLSSKYRAKLVCTNSGEWQLWINYQFIIGGRRVCTLSRESVQAWALSHSK